MADLIITPASFLPSAAAVFKRGTCGIAAVTAGLAVYLDAVTKTYLKAVATGLATAKAVGIAAHAASPGQPLTIIESDPVVALGATSTEGKLLVVSAANAGGIAPSADLGAGNFPCCFGIVLDGGITAKIDFVNAFRTDSAMP